MAASHVMPNSTAKWTITPRRQFGSLFQIQRHQLNDFPSSQFAFIWEKLAHLRQRRKAQILGAAATSTIILSQRGHHLWPAIQHHRQGNGPHNSMLRSAHVPNLGLQQVMDIAPANRNRPWEQNLCPLCPSCAQVNETCSHILFCNHVGQVDALMKSIDLLEQ